MGDSSPVKAVYNPKVFIPHAASLGQAFAHCRRFSTAATRRCIARVAVLSLRVTLSRPLPVIALVGHYPTNKLIGRGPLTERFSCPNLYSALAGRDHRALAPLSRSYSRLNGMFPRVTNSFAANAAHSLQPSAFSFLAFSKKLLVNP